MGSLRGSSGRPRRRGQERRTCARRRNTRFGHAPYEWPAGGTRNKSAESRFSLDPANRSATVRPTCGGSARCWFSRRRLEEYGARSCERSRGSLAKFNVLRGWTSQRSLGTLQTIHLPILLGESLFEKPLHSDCALLNHARI